MPTSQPLVGACAYSKPKPNADGVLGRLRAEGLGIAIGTKAAEGACNSIPLRPLRRKRRMPAGEHGASSAEGAVQGRCGRMVCDTLTGSMLRDTSEQGSSMPLHCALSAMGAQPSGLWPTMMLSATLSHRA